MSQNSKLLAKHSAKKRRWFKKDYPFPIIKNDVEENKDDPSWKCMEGHLQEDCVLVNDEESMQLLYKKGFFGKGTLSKNAPQVSFAKRKVGDEKIERKMPEKRKRTHSPESTKVCSEDDIICVEDSSDETLKLSVDPENEDIEVVLSESGSSSDECDDKPRTNLIKSDSMEKESLQLTFQEAYFLSYGLGCLIVKDNEQPLNLVRLWSRLCDLTVEKNFPVMYAAYHHFRSKGWVVKCGIKYGVDYILYKDGPPFYHGSYSVIVKPVKEQGLRDVRGNRQFTWSSLSAMNRLNTTAGKTLMFLYVIKSQACENKMLTPACISQYKMEEVLVKRWVPCENREDSD